MWKKYILIFEDGGMAQAASISKDEKRACDDGVLEILCIQGRGSVTRYLEGGWHSIDDFCGSQVTTG